MKTAGWVIAALLIGMVLGSWGLKADLRKAKEENARLQEQARSRVRKQTRFDGITTMLNIPQSQETGTPAASSHDQGRRPHPRAEIRTNTAAIDVHRRPPAQGAQAQGEVRGMRQNIETAVNVWKVRSDLARNNFLAEATTDDSQVARFDVLMMAMNLRLSNSIRTWVDIIKTNETMTPETGVRMMNDLSGNLVQVYADMDRELPDWRENTDGAFNAMDFVDPQVAMPLTEVEDIMRTQRWQHAESFTNAPGE